MRQLYLFVTLFFITLIAGAQVPATYYDGISGTGYTLKTNLHNLIDGHNSQSYDALWTHMQSTDNDGVYENDGTVLDMYSENPTGPDPYNFTWVSDQCGNYSGEGSCYNREHSFPKSWFNDGYPMYTDLFHLYPTDGYVNGQRGNYPFGEVGTASWTSQNGSKKGSCAHANYAGTVFEPIDEFKGDFARTYFYMATRYEDVITGWSSDILDGSADKVYVDWYLETMIEWHQNDPVSQKEIDRNNAVYDIQGNANPFIDHPDWVTEIWGGGTIDPEPDNYPTAFSATASAYDQIDLSWTDATGTDLPDGYLIKVNTIGSFTAPSDGTDPAEDSDLSDGAAVVKVNHGIGSHTFTGLNGETTYYFKVWSYTNYGTNIDFKTDGTPPTDNATTLAAPSTIYSGSFEIDAEGWTFYDGNAGGADWERTTDGAPNSTYSPGDLGNDGSFYMWVYGYNSDADDWLITNAFDLSSYTNCTMNFYSWVRNTGTDIVMKVSTDYTGSGDPSANGTWTDLSPTLPASVEAWTSSGSVDLSAYDGESSVYIAFYYGGTDVDRNWAIDDYEVTGYAAGPALSVSPSSLTGFTYEESSGPSTVQSFMLSGSDLDGTDVTLTPPTNYEISTSDFAATNPITLSSYYGSETTIYVRLKAGLSAGTYNSENISISGGGDAEGVSVSCSGEVTPPPDPEPANQPTAFTATANGSDQIDLGWTDADPGSQVPAGYLIKANESGTFSDPSDGTDPAEDTDLSDGSAVVKVAHASGASYSFTGLSAETQYYFKIWSYTNSGSDINFKIDGTPPTANATTDAAATSMCEVFNSGLAGSYTTGTQTLSTGDWYTVAVYAEDAIASNGGTGSAARLNDDTPNASLRTPSLNSVGTVTFWYRELNSGGGTFVLQKSYDNSVWTDVTSQVYSGTTFTEFSYDVNDGVNPVYIRILNDNQAGHLIIDDFCWTSYSTPSNDSDSDVSAGAGSEPATIASTVDAAGEEIAVLDFTFTDAGSGDELATIIDEIQITQGSANDVADWTNAIAGAYLNGNDVTDLAGTVNATNITFASNDMISITDGTSETYTLKIYLKTDLSGITDNNNLEFALNYTNITADASGSSFGSGAPESGDTNVAIDITATEIRFVAQPVTSVVDQIMWQNPDVKVTDVNGNVDVDYADAIAVTSNGTMTGDPVSGAWAGNVATFSGITHEATGKGLTLTASSGVLTDGTSDPFDVNKYCTELMISEYLEGDLKNKAIELFNGTGAAIDLSLYELRQDNNHDGTFERTLSLTGSLAHGKVYLIAHQDGADLIASVGESNIDLLSGNTTIEFNGDDPVGLFKDDGVKAFNLIDVVSDASGNYQDVNLRRKSNVFEPNTTFTLDEWTAEAFNYTPLGTTENPLPVTWCGVSAKPTDKGVAINWSTASEVNNDYFTVEFSTDNRHFNQVGRAGGAGNTNTVKNYSYLHKTPVSGVNYYRIKQVDFDGAIDYSKIVSANWNGMELNELSIEYVHWSTNEHKAMIHFIPGKFVEISIYNITGKQVYKETVKVASAYYIHSINKSNLQDGIYIMRVRSGENIAQQKFVVSGF